MIDSVLTELKNELSKIVKKLGYQMEENDSDFFHLEIPKDRTFGDYSTNVAMRLARVAKMNPRLLATIILEELDQEKLHLAKVEVAGAGFINFTFNPDYVLKVVHDVLNLQDAYGNNNLGGGKRVNLEFVSANPTGYLHVGHGRGAAYGDSLANILKKAGYKVDKEHYVNDAGNQITNLALSILERYKEALGLPFELGEDYYHGKEIITIANDLVKEYGNSLLEKEDVINFLRTYGTNYLLNGLKRDLARFRVHFDTWFSERSLYEAHEVENVLETLKNKGFVYEEDGALWLRTTDYQDEKDRVIVKSDGNYTYLLPDIAYHANKLSRGYEHLIDVLGADHHGYIDRLKAAVSMVGGNSDLIDVEILQMVRVIENGEEVKMSKRSGKAITLVDLLDEVGPDALRYFYVSKSLNTHMDLDLDLMRKKSNENPVFYAQYAHARISSIFRNASQAGIEFKPVQAFKQLDKNKIKSLCLTLLNYPDVIKEAARTRFVHKITHYIDELAYELHSYYNDEKIITDNVDETLEKMTVLSAVKIVLKDALALVGVEAPDQM